MSAVDWKERGRTWVQAGRTLRSGLDAGPKTSVRPPASDKNRKDVARDVFAEDNDVSDIAVRYAGVSKTFDGARLVIDDLNLDIRRGEFLTMLGPSGSGKTTSLMMLAGFETPTSGEILFNGRSLNNVAPHRRDIGMVFQNYALFPHMTVAENLAFPLKARRLSASDIAAKVGRVLDMVQLRGFEDRRPAQLSGGQQQRVAVARALVYEPALVLMDEPLGALDKQLRERMQLELKHLHKNLGLTVVYVTHDQAEALTISDRIAVFNDGRVQQVATPSRLYEAPETVFVADFLGENNRISGVVTGVSGDVCRVQLDDGSQITALQVSPAKTGQSISLCLRPETVRLNPPQDACDNRFEAEMLEQIYLGDHLRVRVRVCGRDDFIIKIPRNHEAASLSVGSTFTVGWRASDCRAIGTSEDGVKA